MIRSNNFKSIIIGLGVCCFFCIGGCASSGGGQAGQQRQFNSPQAAVDSLVAALRANDTNKLNEIFGPDGGEIVSSGDPVADQYQSQKFLAAYDQQHRLDENADEARTLVIGNGDWPFPVPIIKSGGKYMFDTAAGKDEILNRRIGRNELSTEQVCLAIVDAQREYAQRRPMGGDLPEYAKKMVSDPGQKNGLYWPTKEGEQESPLGPLAAEASQEGYRAAQRTAGSPPPPYHGYIYKLLTSQGANAAGGALDYLVNGHLIGGFGVLAYPADYGNSGIMTFMTNQDGVVYQRDLGPETATLAQSINSFDPGPEWKVDQDANKPPPPAADTSAAEAGAGGRGGTTAAARAAAAMQP